MVRTFWLLLKKHFKQVLVVATLIFLACVYLHNDGIPKSISESDKQHVVTTVAELEFRYADVVHLFEDLGAYPDCEAEIIDQLICQLEGLTPVMADTLTNPVFFVPMDDVDATRLMNLTQQLKTASDTLIVEIPERIDSGFYDDEGYELLRIAMKKFSNIEGGPCNRRKCFWCICRQALRHGR